MPFFTLRTLRTIPAGSTAWALRRHPGNAVDMWDGETYRVVLAVRDKPILVAVTQQGTVLDVALTKEDLFPEDRQTPNRLWSVYWAAGWIFQSCECTSRHPRLGHLATPFRGLKPPRLATVFKGLVNGITSPGWERPAYMLSLRLSPGPSIGPPYSLSRYRQRSAPACGVLPLRRAALRHPS